jgi:hypothetical protein
VGVGGPIIQGTWRHAFSDGTNQSQDQGFFWASTSGSVNKQLVSNPQTMTGLWYDPKYSGSGFNFMFSGAGLIVTYYGWDATGNRLWLTSDITTTSITTNSTVDFDMSENTGGTFSSPLHNVASWGKLSLSFSSCTSATGTLVGKDGTQYLSLQMLVGVISSDACSPAQVF